MDRNASDESFFTPSKARLAGAAALACGLLLSGCGGGGDSAGTNTSPSDSTAPMSQTEALGYTYNTWKTTIGTAAALNALHGAMDDMVPGLKTAGDDDRAHALAAGAPAAVTTACKAGGTATLTITPPNAGTVVPTPTGLGSLVPGAHYVTVYTQCDQGSGALNGSVAMDVLAASETSLSAKFTLTQFSLTPDSSFVTAQTLNNSFNLNYTLATVGTVKTAIAHLTTTILTVQAPTDPNTASMTSADLTRKVVTTNGTVTGRSYGGLYTMSGTYNGKPFTTVTSTDKDVTYDADGHVTAGTLKMVFPHHTLSLAVTGGNYVLTVTNNDSNTVDGTYTVPALSS
jgi:hypothetical protein